MGKPLLCRRLQAFKRSEVRGSADSKGRLCLSARARTALKFEDWGLWKVSVLKGGGLFCLSGFVGSGESARRAKAAAFTSPANLER